MKAEKLKHVIVIQEPVRVTDDYGATEITWQDLATVRAKVYTKPSTEVWRNSQTHEVATHIFTIRYRDGVTSDMRIKFNNRYFNIVSITDIGENKDALELLCQS